MTCISKGSRLLGLGRINTKHNLRGNYGPGEMSSLTFKSKEP